MNARKNKHEVERFRIVLKVVFISTQITCTYPSIKLKYPGLRVQKEKNLAFTTTAI